MILAATGAVTAPALAEPTGPSPIVTLDIDDPRGDIALEWAGGPPFRPAAATDAGDIAWVRTIPHGDDVTVQVKVEDVFVYARDYHRSGDDRSSSSAGQRAVIGYDGVTAEIDTDPSGTGLRVRHTYIADRYVQQPCERDAVLAFSRVHDLIAVTLPMECTDAYEPPFRGTVYVLTTTAATHVATRGDRTVSTSFRYYRDKVLTEILT